MPRCADEPGLRPAGLKRRLAAVLLALVAGSVMAEDSPGAAPRQPGEVPSLDEREALRLSQEAIGRMAPDMVLRDRNGKPVRLSDYRGKPLLVSFIYTGCFQVCPAQTRELYEAVRGLDRMLGQSQFNVVSIGFNQPFDSPEAMRSFAAQHRIAHRNWNFLSPTRQQVPELTRAFGFSYVATPAGFDHLLGVSVVDAQGRIHSQVLGNKLRADQLGVPLRELLLRHAPPSPNALQTLVDRVIILCTVYDAETGEYRYDLKLILVIVGGLLFFLTLAVYFLLDWLGQRRQRQDERAACSLPPAVSGSTA
jgi:protein SCO1/2